jgi:hypothetical protein
VRIIDLQRRLREIGRIRIGEKVPTQNGKTRPSKIDVFRFTSRDQQVIDAAAGLWGGTPEPWPDGPGGSQFQVRSTTNQIPVIVPPGDMSFSQSYEVWSAGGCQVRCDGRWDHVTDTACHCDPEARDCKITSRLSLIVPDLPGIGLWRLETHGYYAAVELGGIVDLCAAQAERGVMLPARLRLEHRELKRAVNGKVQTFKFVVPALDLDVHPMSLTAGGHVAGELPAPKFTPVPTDAERALTPSVRAQITAVDDPTARESRQTPLPATGLKPRTVTQVNAAEDPGPGGATDREAVDVTPKPAHADGADMDTPPGPGHNNNGLDIKRVAQKATLVFKADYDAAPRGTKTKVVDRLRHALTYATTKGAATSLKDLDPEQLARVWARLEDIGSGRVTYTADPADDNAGVTFTSQSGKQTTVLWAEIETPT